MRSNDVDTSRGQEYGMRRRQVRLDNTLVCKPLSHYDPIHHYHFPFHIE